MAGPCDWDQIVALGDVYQHMVIVLELESALFGMVTLALVMYFYSRLRLGLSLHPTRERAYLTPLAVPLLPYALFTSVWLLSIKGAQDLTGLGFISSVAFATGDVKFNYEPLIAESVLFGVFSALVTLALHVHFRKGSRTRSQGVMLAVALLMYALSLAHWAFQMSMLREHWDSPPSWQLDMDAILLPFVLLSINVVLSDAIVLWRMCSLCDQHPVARLVAVILLMSTTGMTVASLVLQVQESSGYSPGLTASFNDSAYGIAVLALSLATNLISTSIIGVRTWYYRRDVSKYLSGLNHRSIVEKIMLLLVESGSVYCVIWALYIIDSVGVPQLRLEFSSDTYAFGTGDPEWFSRVMSPLTGIYPTIIIVIVALEQSCLEKTITASRLSAFAAARPAGPPPESNSTRSRRSVSWRTPQSIDLYARGTHREYTSLDAAVSEIEDVGQGERASVVVEGKEAQSEIARSSTPDNLETLGSVHVVPRQVAPAPGNVPLAATLQSGPRGDIELETQRASLISVAAFMSMTGANVANETQEPPSPPSMDLGMPNIAYGQEHELIMPSEDSGRDEERTSASSDIMIDRHLSSSSSSSFM